jgi:hypothetical protein
LLNLCAFPMSQLSQLQRMPITLANEYLLAAESLGLVCRDDCIEGLFFFPNNRFEELAKAALQ